MNILLLPGQNINNREWVAEIKAAIEKDFTNIYVGSYKHWETGEDRADVEVEKAKIAEFVKIWEGQDYIVFGKSIGSIIAMKSFFEKLIKPKAMFFMGVPYALAKQRNGNIDAWFKSIDIPVFIEQKENDPMTSFETLVNVIDNTNIKVSKYERVGEPTDNHHYADIEYIKAKLIELSHES